MGNLQVNVIHTPCHTRGSLCYYVTYVNDDDTQPGALFTGDTLFVGGVGAFFEGNSQDMVLSFQRILQLPRNVIVYCGHDYAMNFFPNALNRDPTNHALRERFHWAEHAKAIHRPAMPSTLEDECATNLFLRVVSNTSVVNALYPQESDGQDARSMSDLMSLVYDTV